jgi:hypothetical protein
LSPPCSPLCSCNDTTAVADGQCQTLIANNASDFCLWGSPTTDELSTIGDIEAAVISYCTNDKLGGRVIPAGAITGLQVRPAVFSSFSTTYSPFPASQVMRTSAYTQWTGHINQTALGLTADDSGGELDVNCARFFSIFSDLRLTFLSNFAASRRRSGWKPSRRSRLLEQLADRGWQDPCSGGRVEQLRRRRHFLVRLRASSFASLV